MEELEVKERNPEVSMLDESEETVIGKEGSRAHEGNNDDDNGDYPDYAETWRSYINSLPANFCSGYYARMEYPLIRDGETIEYVGLKINHWNSEDMHKVFEETWACSDDSEPFLAQYCSFQETIGKLARFCVARGDCNIESLHCRGNLFRLASKKESIRQFIEKQETQGRYTTVLCM